MIALTKILIRRPCEGYYIRWYYNGWHYWHFLPGKQVIKTSGENYRTTGTRQVSISSGQLDYNQCVGVRTILSTREIYLYNDSGWGKIRVEPGSWNDIKNNYIQGYEVELTITIGSREVSQTGYSPTTPTPLPMSNVVYGLLYNWYAMSSVNGIAPTGFRVATLNDWKTLIIYLGGASVAGGKMKETGTTHWNSPNVGATNLSLFTAYGNGKRHSTYSNAPYFAYLKGGSFWHSNETYVEEWQCWAKEAHSFGTVSGSPTLYDKKWGMGIRCLMVNPSLWYEGMIVRDYDLNLYTTTKIGNQVWLQQNLAVTHFVNGTIITEVQGATAWQALTTPGLCAYNNDWNNVFNV